MNDHWKQLRKLEDINDIFVPGSTHRLYLFLQESRRIWEIPPVFLENAAALEILATPDLPFQSLMNAHHGGPSEILNSARIRRMNWHFKLIVL